MREHIKTQRGTTMVSWIIISLFLNMLLFAKVFDGHSAAELLENSLKETYKNQEAAGGLP